MPEVSCSVAKHLKSIWGSDPALNSEIPAESGDGNRFHEEGVDLSGKQLPLAILEETRIVEPVALGAGAVLDNRVYQLRIYTKSKSQAVSLSVAARGAYLSAHPAQTNQGEVKKIKIDGGVHGKLNDGTRFVVHQLIVICVEKFY